LIEVERRRQQVPQDQTKLPASYDTHGRYSRFAKRWRMTLTETVDFAIENLEGMTRDELVARIERRPVNNKRREPQAEACAAGR
jgi:hypothetical protein